VSSIRSIERLTPVSRWRPIVAAAGVVDLRRRCVPLSMISTPVPIAASMIAIAIGKGSSEECKGLARMDPSDPGVFE
jgi:hypothetical protein